jgi:hypothetical protein
LLSDPPEASVLGRVVNVGGPAVKDSARREELLEDRAILRVVGLLGSSSAFR